MKYLRSIRARLTALYTLMLFMIATGLLALIYITLAGNVADLPVSRREEVNETVEIINGRKVVTRSTSPPDLRGFEQKVNEETLASLRRISVVGVGGALLTSAALGYLIAGRVLKPIGHIASVATEIQSSDLSRRINLAGPDDELRRLAGAFDAMLERLEGAFESQRAFLEDTSHELRNPLAVMRTNLDVLIADPDPAPQETKRTIQVLHRTINRMSALTEDLLAVARRQALTRSSESLEITNVLHEVSAELAPHAGTAGISLVVDAPQPEMVRGDRLALKRALSNLVANAIDHAPEGSTVRLAAGSDEHRVVLSVTDQGPGVSDDLQSAIWNRGWSTSDGGAGLGLAIVRQIVSEHGGEARVESAVGGGARFEILLPKNDS